MLAELPKIAGLADGWTGIVRGINRVGRIRYIVLEISEQGIDLRRLKAGQGYVEAIVDEQVRQADEFIRESCAIPASALRDAVVGQQQCALARLAQAIDDDRRNDLEPKQLGGFQPPVAGEQHTALIEQHRGRKSDRLNAVGNL